MGAFSKFITRERNYPKYSVSYAKAIDYVDKGAYPVTFIGINNHSKYGDGRQPYIDILTDTDDHIRVNVSHSYASEFEEMIADVDAMKEVDEGKISVSFKKRTGKNGTYAGVVWSESE